MPIVFSTANSDPCLSERLMDAGVPVLSEHEAQQQDIRPARIGIMNNMPSASAENTEIQLLRWIGSQELLQIEPVMMKLDDDPREKKASKRAEIFKRYTPFSEVAEEGLDGLIVTGDNLEIKAHSLGYSGDPDLDFEALPAEKVSYYEQLQEVMDWADSSVYSSFYICLGAHFKLRHKYGIVKEVNPEKGKIFGVYDHEVVDKTSPLVRDANDSIRAPHSRWGDVPVEKILAKKALNLVAANEEAGWLFVTAENEAGGTDVFTQAHIEYGKFDLHAEFQRDKNKEPALAVPPGYYKDDVPRRDHVRQTWATDGRVAHENWIGGMVYPGFSKSS